MTAALRWPARALIQALQRAYLGYLLRAAESDLRWMQHQIDHAATIPEQMAVHRNYISALRVRCRRAASMSWKPIDLRAGCFMLRSPVVATGMSDSVSAVIALALFLLSARSDECTCLSARHGSLSSHTVFVTVR